MRLINNDGIEYELIEISDPNFLIEEKKAIPAMTLTPSKEGWNDPNSDTIQRRYKGIKIGDKYYGYRQINN